MAIRNRVILFLAVLLASTAIVAAAEVKLTALTLQAGNPVDINFAKTDRAPSRATMQASLLYDNGQTSVKLSFQKMEPAVLFAGDISAYVLWAVTIDGTAENLGEVVVDKKDASGAAQYYTGKRVLALMATAEPFATTTRPTELVLFTSGEARAKLVQNTPFAFKNFQTDAKPALDSISGIQYNDTIPVAVKQAKKALEIAEKINAAAVNPKAVDGAKAAFAKAQASGGNKKAMADSARVATQLAAQAIKEATKANEAKAAAEAETKRLAEKAALEQRATSAEGESQRIAQQLKEVEVQRLALAMESANLAKLTEKLATEKDTMAAERDAVKADRDTVKADRDKVAAEKYAMAAERDAVKADRDSVKADRDKVAAERDAVAAEREAIKKERDELAGMLKGALSSVAETTETARGVIVSLSGILFDVGKATLKPASQLTVAKLAGILMVFPKMNLSIEGYTDSTGSSELNMRLSMERARSVYEFLMGQGFSSSRMKYQGFGPENPVAPNDTEANRAKNRRVEVVLTQAGKEPQ
jgi:outer membrane protein OmpA-like peptidoglycan-associated protein